MVNILINMSIVNGMIDPYKKNDSIQKVKYMQGVFKSENVSEEEFIKSYKFYAQDLEKISEIHQKALEKIKKLNKPKPNDDDK